MIMNESRTQSQRSQLDTAVFVVAKNSVGRKKKRRYNEGTGLAWHAWHLHMHIL